jgi:hypothetical protein
LAFFGELTAIPMVVYSNHAAFSSKVHVNLSLASEKSWFLAKTFISRRLCSSGFGDWRQIGYLVKTRHGEKHGPRI